MKHRIIHAKQGEGEMNEQRSEYDNIQNNMCQLELFTQKIECADDNGGQYFKRSDGIKQF